MGVICPGRRIWLEVGIERQLEKIRGVREQLRTVRGHDDIILDANPAAGFDINAGLVRKDRADAYRVMLVIILVMRLEAQAMPERMREFLFITRLRYVDPGDRVVLFPLHAGAERTECGAIRGMNNTIDTPHLRVGFFARNKHGAREVRTVTTPKPPAEIHDHGFARLETPVTSVVMRDSRVRAARDNGFETIVDRAAV